MGGVNLDDAVARIAELEAALGANYRSPPDWLLTEYQEIILGVLVTREYVSVDAFMAAIYGARVGDRPGPKNIQVMIFQLRKKLKPHGVTILLRKGAGYYIDRAARLLLQRHVGDGLTGSIAEAVRLSAELKRTVAKLRDVTGRFTAALTIADALILQTEKFTADSGAIIGAPRKHLRAV